MPKIRCLAIAIIIHEGRLLVSDHEGRLLVSDVPDVVKAVIGYRPLGGGIEFGETGEEAVRRELREEADLELTNVRYLATLENIFSYLGNPGHELVRLYAADFADRSLYAAEEIACIEDDGQPFTAHWLPITHFGDDAPLYPNGLLEWLCEQQL